MKKIEQHICKECQTYHIERETFICDTCGKDTIRECLGVPITIQFGYGSDLDGEEYHFDTLKCLLRFILDEIRKQNPENRFVYGRDLGTQKGEEKR
ncbi:MAG TPA: hypothetical protein VMZ91_13610 [Candidatus Paceibacterota bacterium]|nr:hypothetical protein [Candidatus Paceibacterota bacterium]